MSKPTTKEDWELFNQLINSDNVYNNCTLDMEELRKLATELKAEEIQVYEELYVKIAERMGMQSIDTQLLTIAQLRRLAKEIKAEEIKECERFYTEVAEKMGVQCIDNQLLTIEQVGNSIVQLEANNENIPLPEVMRDTRLSGAENIPLPEVMRDTRLSGAENIPLSEIMSNNQSIIEIKPTPETSIKDISTESTDKLIETIRSVTKQTDSRQSIHNEIMEGVEDYTEEDRNNEVMGIPFKKVNNAVKRGLNVVYRGVPGCGKTFAAKCDAMVLIGKRTSNRIKQLDFTENLDYSDTMVGLKQSESGKWQYVRGEIAEFCTFALQYVNLKFVLILNELTRANTEAVLGQMFTAMENKYRGLEFKLDNGDTFICPKNLIILATMNGTDKGVKKLDRATEERFYIIDIKPLWEEWAKGGHVFTKLVSTLGVTSGTEEYSIIKRLCKEVESINSHFAAGGIMTADNQIGQRQLLQFIGQTDIDNIRIKYDKETLEIIIEQIISRAEPMVDMCSEIAENIQNLRQLIVSCST